MLVPPPVPVTHPKVQNLRHSSGMRLAGCWGSVDWIRWSLSSEDILGRVPSRNSYAERRGTYLLFTQLGSWEIRNEKEKVGGWEEIDEAAI